MSYILERHVKIYPEAPWMKLPDIETRTRSEAERKRRSFDYLCEELKIRSSSEIYHS